MRAAASFEAAALLGVGCLKSVIFFPQRILVRVARFLGLQLRIVELEAGIVPVLHRHHRVVVCCERFFGVDGIDPVIHCILVFLEKLIEVRIFHECELSFEVNPRQWETPSFHQSFTIGPQRVTGCGLSLRAARDEGLDAINRSVRDLMLNATLPMKPMGNLCCLLSG